jgi:hypothetical protein
MNQKQFSRKTFALLIGVVIIAVVAIAVTAKLRHRKNTSQNFPGTGTVQSGTPSQPPKKGVVFSNDPYIIPGTTTQTATADNSSGTKHGSFALFFTVTGASSYDIYINSACHATPSGTGISFSLLKNGAPINGTLSSSSCLLLSRSGTKTPNGNYLIKAAGNETFELVVADHPETSGNYQVKITTIGFSKSDTTTADQSIMISPQTAGGLITKNISL